VRSPKILKAKLKEAKTLVNECYPHDPKGYRLERSCGSKKADRLFGMVGGSEGKIEPGVKRMKLYDSKSAPNPRRARIFLAEKGIA
jgi:hypothetical protein